MRALAFLALMLVGGCLSNWQMTYKSMLDGVPLSERTDLVSHEGSPRHVVGSDLAEDTANLKSLGYVVIGYSSFNSALANTDMAVFQGERVGAAVVLTISSFSHESEQTISVPVQDVTATTVDEGKVTSASGQSVDYQGTTTTTVEGLT